MSDPRDTVISPAGLGEIDPLEQAKLDYAEATVDYRYWHIRERQRPDAYTSLRLAYATEALHRTHDRLKLALAGVYDDAE